MSSRAEFELTGGLSAFLTVELKKFIQHRGISGGTVASYRSYIAHIAETDPDRFNAFQFEALMAAATQKWRTPPRKAGPDLFSIGGEVFPEYVTRPARGVVVLGADFDDEDVSEKFEKVDQGYATVADGEADLTIKLRKAVQASAAADRLGKQVDEAKRRAQGNMVAFLRDLAD